MEIKFKKLIIMFFKFNCYKNFQGCNTIEKIICLERKGNVGKEVNRKMSNTKGLRDLNASNSIYKIYLYPSSTMKFIY